MHTQPRGVPPHFVVIVPGYMGSKLRDRTTGRIVWVDFGSIPKNPLQWDAWLTHLLQTMTYPNDDLEPAGIMDEVVYAAPWAKQEQYGRLIEALGAMGYHADASRYPEDCLDVHCFAYDWRQGNRISARQLAQAIERWRGLHPGAKAWIIAHSNGGLVARWCIEKESGRDAVERLFLMASPWDGTPKAMHMLFSGLDTLFRQRFGLFDLPRCTRGLVRSFPSLYQLVPYQDLFLRGLNNEPVTPFEGRTWLERPEHLSFLADGLRFNQELGTTPSVETLCFFGRKKATTTCGTVHFSAGGRWSEIEWTETQAGDGTVPERSAVHPHAQEKWPFCVGHGDIYVNPAVLEFLQWEMIDKFEPGKRALVREPEVSVLFEPERDACSPREPIRLSAQVLRPETARSACRPIENAVIDVQLAWHGPLHGADKPPWRVRSVHTHSSPNPCRAATVVRSEHQSGKATTDCRRRCTCQDSRLCGRASW